MIFTCLVNNYNKCDFRIICIIFSTYQKYILSEQNVVLHETTKNDYDGNAW